MSPFRGIIPPLVTPFDAEGRIDEAVHRREVRHMVNCGVHGLAVGGSTGEGHTLSDGEVRLLTAAAVEEAAGRAPVIAGIITNSTKQALERARAVADLRVAAFQVTPPHYLFRPDDDSLLRHFAAIAEATGIPVIIYNVVPWCYLSPRTLCRILAEAEGVVGVKQSATDLKMVADLLLLIQDLPGGKPVSILSAVDALLYPSFCLGAHGSVAAILTAAPELCVQLWEAVHVGDHRKSEVLHRQLLRIWNAIDGPNLPANVKTAMRLQGREGGFPRAPMPLSSPEQVKAIGDALRGRDE